MKIVATSGCFDLIHPGHLRLFAHMRRLAGEDGLVVVLMNTDSYIRGWKKREPAMLEGDRLEVLAALRDVDVVIPTRHENPCHLIGVIQPDIWVKGNDYGTDIPEALTLTGYGGKLELVDTGYRVHSGDIRARIEKNRRLTHGASS